ncbi:Hypothetical predicted protein [Cloeon dipterum]|uniref:Uncharacterized protein n=1 Tax=Cloeon dipterum TaxID=197152 RepID=A0A8S1DKL5_9INSE|nr:Hypothetical predicted protein [Cloeon dipterum]
MSSARPLCVLCERPMADGAVQAVHVDKEKLQTWLLNVCGYEFAEEIEDEDLICNFCIWHAEFLAKQGLDFGTDSWWPQDLDFLDDAAKELRKSYFDGKVEQSWVQLEQIDESESEEEETESKAGTEQKKSKCFYCVKSYHTRYLTSHVRKEHKNAIRCANRKCATYFHTQLRKKQSTSRIFTRCQNHVRRVHSEFSVKCTLHGCLFYFKTDDEMKSQFDSTHKENDEAKILECNCSLIVADRHPININKFNDPASPP